MSQNGEPGPWSTTPAAMPELGVPQPPPSTDPANRGAEVSVDLGRARMPTVRHVSPPASHQPEQLPACRHRCPLGVTNAAPVPAGLGPLPRGYREAAQRVLRALQRQHTNLLLGARSATVRFISRSLSVFLPQFLPHFLPHCLLSAHFLASCSFFCSFYSHYLLTSMLWFRFMLHTHSADGMT